MLQVRHDNKVLTLTLERDVRYIEESVSLQVVNTQRLLQRFV
jgi:hypothetical protein